MLDHPGFILKKRALALAIGYVLAASAVQAQEQSASTEKSGEVIEEIVVQGVRESQAKAIDLKRQSANVIDSIVAEDIGKLPDTTITDSLQRVTGVQIKREANEGTSLNIRGMPQVLTTLNGEQFLSPWNITDVGANYSDIPASMISGVDVYKSQSASAIAGGISGIVDLKTIRPMSLKEGFTGNLRYEGSQGSRSDKEIKADGTTGDRKPDYNLSAFLGYNSGEKFGFTLGGFKSSTYNANYQMYSNPQFAFLDKPNGTPTDPLDLDGDGDLVNDWYLAPTSYGATSSFMTREREGGSGSFEFEINDYLKLKGDVFYSRMDQYDRGVQANFDGANNFTSYEVNGTPGTPQGLNDTLLAGSIVGNGSNFSYTDVEGNPQTASIHTVRVAEVLSPAFSSVSTNKINRTAAINSNLQLDYDNLDNMKGSVRYIHAEAEKQYRQATLTQGNPAWNWVDVDGIPGKDPIQPFNLTVDYRGEFPSFSYDRDLSDANNLEFYQASAQGTNTDATLNVGRVDFTYKFSGATILESVDTGLRYGDREAHNTQFYYVTPTQRYADDQRIPIEKRNQLYTGNQAWQRYPDWRRFNYADETQALRDAGLYNNGFTAEDPSITVFRDFGPFKGFEGGVSALNPAVWDNPLAFMNRLYPGTKTVDDPAYQYDVDEASTSGYVQFNLNDSEGLWGIPYSGNIGLQVLQTQRQVTRNIIPDVLDNFNSIGAVDYQRLAFVYDKETKERSFTQVLPSANFNFYPSDDVIVRLGASKTTSRNDLQNVGSGLSLWYTQCDKTDANGDRVLVTDSSGNKVGDTVTCVGGGSDQGNIDIKPWSANVYNSSAEWYFDENAILGLGLFYIDVNESVQSFQEHRSFIDADGIDRGNTGNVWVSQNVGASSLYGMELGYKQPFTFLPGKFLSATGIEFNYTYSQSESTDIDIEGNTLPLPSNSKNQANMILWYDKDGVNVRLAYNWRSREYDSRAGLNTSGQPVNLGNWYEPVGYLDLSVNYWVNPHLSFYVNGTNLTEQSRNSYAQYEDQLQNIWVQERRFAIGVTLSL